MKTITWLSPQDAPEWFPPLEQALEEPAGLLAAGGDLSPERLIAAYQRGIFPWYSPGQPVLWWSPDPRAVLFPEEFRCARSLAKRHKALLLDEPLAAMGAREARLIIGLIERLRARGDIAIVMIAHNYAQTLEICDRVILMQHGEVTFASQAAATSAEELLEIVRREYRAARTG